MGNNEPAVDQSDFRIRDSYGLKYIYVCTGARVGHRLERAANMIIIFIAINNN